MNWGHWLLNLNFIVLNIDYDVLIPRPWTSSSSTSGGFVQEGVGGKTWHSLRWRTKQPKIFVVVVSSSKWGQIVSPGTWKPVPASHSALPLDSRTKLVPHFPPWVSSSLVGVGLCPWTLALAGWCLGSWLFPPASIQTEVLLHWPVRWMAPQEWRRRRLFQRFVQLAPTREWLTWNSLAWQSADADWSWTPPNRRSAPDLGRRIRWPSWQPVSWPFSLVAECLCLHQGLAVDGSSLRLWVDQQSRSGLSNKTKLKCMRTSSCRGWWHLLLHVSVARSCW